MIVKMNNVFSMTYVNIWLVQKIYAKNVSPFWAPYLKGQPLFLGIDRKVLSFPTSFVQQVITNSWPFSRHFRKKILGADPVTP